MKSKNKFIIIALVCMIAISSVWAGRTYAYFTASSNASGTITMGTLKVNNFGELDASTSLKVVPNQTVTKNFKATIESDIKYYKRLSLTATVDVATGKSHDSTCGDYVDDDTKILNAAVQGFEKYTADDGSIYYYSLAPVTPTDTTTEENFTVNIAIHDWVGKGGCDYYMGATIKVNVKVEVIQADYLESDTTGTSYTDVTAIHNKWTKRVCSVKIKFGGVRDTSVFAYALDNETSYIEVTDSEFTLEVQQGQRLSLIFNIKEGTASSYTPNWTMDDDSVKYVDYVWPNVGGPDTESNYAIIEKNGNAYFDCDPCTMGEHRCSYMLLTTINGNSNIVAYFE